MILQNYSGEDAYSRWRNGGLLTHLKLMRQRYRFGKFVTGISDDLYPGKKDVSAAQHWMVTKFGLLTWGVFSRAFWPIYQKGSSPLFFGSVVLSCAPDDEDAPSLFEVAEQIRIVQDFNVPTNGIEDFARIIRDDYALDARVPVPAQIAMQEGYSLQTIGIRRDALPCGYLHHRLVPIVTHPRIPYATILPGKYWGEEFTKIWMSGAPPLSERDLEAYRQDSPEIKP